MSSSRYCYFRGCCRNSMARVCASFESGRMGQNQNHVQCPVNDLFGSDAECASGLNQRLPVRKRSFIVRIAMKLQRWWKVYNEASHRVGHATVKNYQRRNVRIGSGSRSRKVATEREAQQTNA